MDSPHLIVLKYKRMYQKLGQRLGAPEIVNRLRKVKMTTVRITRFLKSYEVVASRSPIAFIVYNLAVSQVEWVGVDELFKTSRICNVL